MRNAPRASQERTVAVAPRSGWEYAVGVIDQILYASIALIALTNPLAELPFFFAATDGFSRAELRRAAVKGRVRRPHRAQRLGGRRARILGLFDVSFAAFRTAGGLVIILAALEMLRGAGFGITGVRRAPGETEDHLWVPLVMPLIAGPASITAVITLALDEPGVLIGVPVATLIAVVVASVGVLAVLLAASILSNALSRRAVRIFERFSGLILLAIGWPDGPRRHPGVLHAGRRNDVARTRGESEEDGLVPPERNELHPPPRCG